MAGKWSISQVMHASA